MENEFVTYEQAIQLKELGFDEPCMFVHDTWGNTKNWTEDGEGEHRNSDKNASIYYSAPLKQQVFRWFRKEHHMFSHIMTYEGNEIPRFKGEFAYFAEIDFLIAHEEIEKPFKSYEEAESACIDRLIEIVKKK